MALTNITQSNSLGNLNITKNTHLYFYYWQPTEKEYKNQQILQGKEYLEPHIRLQKLKEKERKDLKIWKQLQH